MLFFAFVVSSLANILAYQLCMMAVQNAGKKIGAALSSQEKSYEHPENLQTW